MGQANQSTPTEIYYRRTHGKPVWVSFQGVHGLKFGRNGLQNPCIYFRAINATEIINDWNAHFWGELIVVRRYAASNDLQYFPKGELRCSRNPSGGLEVSVSLYPSRLPEVPREMRGWTGVHSNHLSYTARHASLGRVIELFMGFERPDAEPGIAQPVVIPRDTSGKPIILGRAGAARRTITPSDEDTRRSVSESAFGLERDRRNPV